MTKAKKPKRPCYKLLKKFKIPKKQHFNSVMTFDRETGKLISVKHPKKLPREPQASLYIPGDVLRDMK